MSHLPHGWNDLAASAFAEATASRALGAYAVAREKCRVALEALPLDSARARGAICREIGLTYHLVDDYAAALPWYERARDLMPLSESASVVVFHCYYKLEKLEQALNEALRLCELRSSDEYREFLCDLPDVPSELQALHSRIRALLERPERTERPERPERGRPGRG